MPQIRRTALSRADYLEIWEYIASDNPLAADRLLDQLDTYIELLAQSPGLGRARPEFSPTLRSFPLEKYLIFYRPISDGIELIRVLHGARDIQSDHFRGK